MDFEYSSLKSHLNSTQSVKFNQARHSSPIELQAISIWFWLRSNQRMELTVTCPFKILDIDGRFLLIRQWGLVLTSEIISPGHVWGQAGPHWVSPPRCEPAWRLSSWPGSGTCGRSLAGGRWPAGRALLLSSPAPRPPLTARGSSPGCSRSPWPGPPPPERPQSGHRRWACHQWDWLPSPGGPALSGQAEVSS